MTPDLIIITHCRHGLDLRIYPRCYLCQPPDGSIVPTGCLCPVTWFGIIPPPCPVHNPPRYYPPNTTTWTDHS